MMRRLSAAWRAFCDPNIANDTPELCAMELAEMRKTFQRQFYLQVEGQINDLQKRVRALALRGNQ